jgi:hypothetical protein
MQRRFVFIICVLMLALAGCASIEQVIFAAGNEDSFSPDAALVERGITVYREQYCGICHELTVANTRGTFGPNHDQMGLIATQRIQSASYTGSADTAQDYIMESLVKPQLYVVADYAATSHRMPAYDFIPAEDLEALVHLLMSQR